MFAVPGWSLGPLKRESPPDNPSQERRNSKKRKRKQRSGEDEHNSNTRKAKEKLSDLRRTHSRKSVNVNQSSRPSKIRGSKSPKRAQQTAETATTAYSPGVTHAQVTDKLGTSSPELNINRKKRREDAVIDNSIEAANTELLRLEPSKPPDQNQFKLTPMQAAMRQKLVSARFRHLNQTLYNVSSSEAQQLFKSNPSFFREYHAGFQQQVSSWPENPVDTFSNELKARGNARSQGNKSKQQKKPDHSYLETPPLPRTNGVCTVADLGCGDARLASEMQSVGKKLSIRVLSYDLHSDNPLVTKADISHVPLDNGGVNIAVFCLALMGTNWVDFVEEAWRILHWKGELWVAEIKSRFARAKSKQVDHSIGRKRKPPHGHVRQEKLEVQHDDEQLRVEVDGSESTKEQTDVSSFVTVLERRGFGLTGQNAVDLSNKMFVRMRFTKSKNPTSGKYSAHGQVGIVQDNDSINENTVLKPCIYKTR